MAKQRVVLDQEGKAKVIKWIKEGLLSREECCERLEIDPRAIYQAARRDPEFKRRLEEVEFNCHDELVTAMYKHAHTKDYRAAWQLLSAKWHQKWGKKNDSFSKDEVVTIISTLAAMVKQYVPDERQLEFSQGVETLMRTIEFRKKD